MLPKCVPLRMGLSCVNLAALAQLKKISIARRPYLGGLAHALVCVWVNSAVPPKSAAFSGDTPCSIQHRPMGISRFPLRTNYGQQTLADHGKRLIGNGRTTHQARIRCGITGQWAPRHWAPRHLSVLGELVDELILLEAMRHCKGNQSEAARVLGLSPVPLCYRS